MRLTTVLLSATLLAVASSATAQTQAVSAAPVMKHAKDPNKLICKTAPTTGSRLKPNRDCRTAQQWSDAQAIDRRDIERIQLNRYNGNE